MKEKLAKLIDVKTIITFSIIFSVLYLTINDKIDSNKIYELALVVMSFYFAKQSNNK